MNNAPQNKYARVCVCVCGTNLIVEILIQLIITLQVLQEFVQMKCEQSGQYVCETTCRQRCISKERHVILEAVFLFQCLCKPLIIRTKAREYSNHAKLKAI